MTKNYNDLGVEFKYLIVNDMDQKFGLWVNLSLIHILTLPTIRLV